MPRNIKYKPYRLTTSYYRNLKKNKESSENTKIRAHTSHDVASTSSAREQIITEPQDLDVHINDARNPLTREEFFEIDLIPEQDEFDRNEEKILEDKLTLLTELHHWAISHKLTLASVTNLLKILRNHDMTELPKDGRTLLKTPSVTEITEMGGGKFWYNGPHPSHGELMVINVYVRGAADRRHFSIYRSSNLDFEVNLTYK